LNFSIIPIKKIKSEKKKTRHDTHRYETEEKEKARCEAKDMQNVKAMG